jgi:hypothetical protein
MPLTGWKRAGKLRHSRGFWRASATELGLIRTGQTGSGNGRASSGQPTTRRRQPKEQQMKIGVTSC